MADADGQGGRRLKHRGAEPAVPRRAHPDSTDHLSPVSGRPPFREYLSQLVERRHFIGMQAWSQSTTQHRGMLLGNVWLVLAPALDGLIYFMIFGLILRAGGAIENFFGYLVIGVFLFTYTSRTINSSATSIHNNRGLIRAFTFPRAVLPVAATLRETFAMLPVLITLIVLLIAVPPHALPTAAWVLLPVVFLVHAVFNQGIGFLLARVATALPDARQLIPYLLRLWFYGSAVMFAVDRFDSVPWIGQLVRINPMYQLLTIYRSLLLDATIPPIGQWVTVTLWALGALVVGALFFWRAEVSYGRE